MKEHIYEYDPAAALDGPEAMAIFMADAFETGHAQYIAKAMGVVARVKGMTERLGLLHPHAPEVNAAVAGSRAEPYYFQQGARVAKPEWRQLF